MRRNGSQKNSYFVDCATVEAGNPYKSDAHLTITDYENRYLVLVADGQNSQTTGTSAHSIVMDVFKNSFIHSSDFDSIELYLRQTVYVAASLLMQNHFFDTSVRSTTTLSGFVIDKDGGIFTVNVGNSRVYLYRNKTLKLLTRDHTKAFELFLNGHISEEEIHQHPDKHSMTSIIGNGLSTMKVDINRVGKIKSGDVLITCTDGFYPFLYDKKLKKHLKKYLSSTNPAETLLSVATQGEQPEDNMTVCVLIAKG